MTCEGRGSAAHVRPGPRLPAPHPITDLLGGACSWPGAPAVRKASLPLMELLREELWSTEVRAHARW